MDQDRYFAGVQMGSSTWSRSWSCALVVTGLGVPARRRPVVAGRPIGHDQELGHGRPGRFRDYGGRRAGRNERQRPVRPALLRRHRSGPGGRPIRPAAVGRQRDPSGHGAGVRSRAAGVPRAATTRPAQALPPTTPRAPISRRRGFGVFGCSGQRHGGNGAGQVPAGQYGPLPVLMSKSAGNGPERQPGRDPAEQGPLFYQTNYSAPLLFLGDGSYLVRAGRAAAPRGPSGA